ncbi:TonB-dependent receptor [Aquimarina agarivorans]|uniref:TonB-dependent receptor n=1 Tax=Aquimarina agarivorans TaxID=980584 RepID=UPI000248F015|nr:TonB-dependent receptor [Aquimarina agarivorans]
MKKALFFLLLLASTVTFAQGNIQGVVNDKELAGSPLPFADVYLKGTTKGTTTDFDGKYVIENIDPGTYTLVISFVGYEAQEFPNTLVKDGETLTVNATLSASAASLSNVIVQGTSAVKESESALLVEQKKAVEIKQAIGAKEISKKGVSDAEGAVVKVVGITKQQGRKNVFVRGLGDRYNTTTLNGLPLPSENPDFKNINLDFFSTDLIQSVNINKNNNASLYGDATGANVDIISKELSGKDFLKLDVSTGINTNTYDRSFVNIDGGTDLGFTDSNIPIDNLNFYDFENSINNDGVQSFQNNLGVSLSGGKKFYIGDNKLKVLATANIQNDYQRIESPLRQTTNDGTVFRDQARTSYEYEVSQQFFGNFKYSFGGHEIALNSLYIHKNTQNLTEAFGLDTPEEVGDLNFVRRQQINDNNLIVNQLISDFEITDKIDFSASGAYNKIIATEPDRRSNDILVRGGDFVVNPGSAGNNERYFSRLEEDDYAINTFFKFDFSNEDDDKNRDLFVGYNYRNTFRTFDATIFNHDFDTTFGLDIDDLDATFNQSNINNIFRLITGRGRAGNPRAFIPFFYDGERIINSFYTKFNYEFSEKFFASVGLRYEQVDLEVDFNTNIANSLTDGLALIDEDYFLPSLSLKYAVNDKMNIRLGSSLSYTLPQFLEIAPFLYQDINNSIQGNQNLFPSENINADLKLEYFFERDEFVALSGFYKNIKDPIARSEVPSAGNTLTFLNVGGEATVFGLELELRKNLIADDFNTLTVDFNGSYLVTDQELTNVFASFTNEKDELEGATPVLLNSSLVYNYKNDNDKELLTSLVFNYFSDRIYSIGTRGFENIVEKGVPTLDFVSKYNFNKKSAISFKVKNILNQDFEFQREGAGNVEDITISKYNTGLDISIGYSHSF